MIDYNISSEKIQFIPVELKPDYFRDLRFKRQNISATLALKYTDHRVKSCLRYTAGTDLVKLMYSGSHNKAFYKGLQTCGSVWDCPVCAAKISARRKVELREGITNWSLGGGTAFMVTFTLSHNMGDSLEKVRQGLTDAIRFLKSGSPWKRITNKYHITGSIFASEVLFNRVNGWHYHKHGLFLTDLMPGHDLKDLQEWIYARYNKYLNTIGLNSAAGIGVVVSPVSECGQAYADYINKWGLVDELTSNALKQSSGITPFDLLDLPELEGKFIEYSNTMYGKNQLSWSRGLRKLLGLGIEITDMELVELDDCNDGICIMEFNKVQWKYIVNNNLRADMLARAEGGIKRFYDYVLDLGLLDLGSESIKT